MTYDDDSNVRAALWLVNLADLMFKVGDVVALRNPVRPEDPWKIGVVAEPVKAVYAGVPSFLTVIDANGEEMAWNPRYVRRQRRLDEPTDLTGYPASRA